MSGFYLMHRGWLENPVFGSPKREPFCRRSAWTWLIEHAAFTPTAARGRDLLRGQLSYSVRELAEAWGWPKTSVHRFLMALVPANMIRCSTGTGACLITICNYDKYQVVDSSAGTRAGHQRDTSGTLKNEVKEDNQGSVLSPPIVPPKPEGYGFTEWWQRYPHKVAKPAASKAFQAARRKAPQEVLLAGLDRYMATKPADRPWCNPATWLNQERWNDQPALVLASSLPMANSPAESADDAQWRSRIRRFSDTGFWLERLGPDPTHPRCYAPAALLSEFGYGHKAAAE